MRKVPLQNKRNALFKRGLERNGKNINVLEFDVQKDGEIVLCNKKIGW